jgi:pimeloyl-ACP methyl ester carboxylesterase
MSPMRYVLIPGAGGAAWFWHRIVPLLGDAVAVELPAGDDKAGLPEYAEVVAAAAGDADEVVLIAHSLGGFTAPLAAGLLPVSRIVLVNAMIPAPGETAGQWWESTGQGEARRELDRREGRDPDAPYDPKVLFFHDVPDDLTAEAMALEEQQSEKPFGQPAPAWPDVPTEVLTGRDDRIFPADFQTRIAQERLGITPTRLDGGHLVPLSHPVELAELILS